MIEKINLYIKKIKRRFENIKFKKEVSKIKKRLYIVWENKTKTYKSERNKFKMFKTKLEFDNAFKDIKKINIYHFFVWIFLILASAYIIVFSHYFSLKSVDVIRNDELVNIDLAYKSIENIRYKPMVFIDKSIVKNSILSHQPNIKDISINKIYPSNIKITLWSYKDLYNVNFNWKYYKVTENWVLVPTSKQEENILQIVWIDNFWIIDYKQFFDPVYVNKIREIEDLIKQKNSFVVIDKMTYYKKERELHILTDKWILLIFDLTKDSKVQVEKLNIFYKEYFKKIKFWIIYVDLRVNERVIYCSTETEFQCNKNLENIYWKK